MSIRTTAPQGNATDPHLMQPTYAAVMAAVRT